MITQKNTGPLNFYVSVSAQFGSDPGGRATNQLLDELEDRTGHRFDLATLRQAGVYTLRQDGETRRWVHRIEAPYGLNFVAVIRKCRWEGCGESFSMERLRRDADRNGRPRGIFFGRWCPKHDDEVWQNHLASPGS